MYSATDVMLGILAGVLIGLMISIIIDALKVKKHGKWQRGLMWYAVDKEGNLLRAQFEHPSQGVKDAERILDVSRRG